MKHSYTIGCECERCVKEGARRYQQALSNFHTITRGRKRADRPKVASREEQHARYLDCGPQNWDDR